MRVYLVNPPYIAHFGRGARWQEIGRAGTLYYPIWLAYAAGVLDESYEIRLVDAIARKWSVADVINDIKEFQPDLIVTDSSFPSLDNDVKVAEDIKQNYGQVTIALVGPPASQLPAKILESEGIDIVARWEYDLTLKEVAGAIVANRGFSDIKGISYRNHGQIIHNPERPFTTSADLDKIPFVSCTYRKYLNIRDYFLGQSLYPEVQIFTGRGCPSRCTFCSWPQTLMGRDHRSRSTGNVLDELEWVQVNLPEVREVFFEDDTFTLNRKRVLKFCKEYREKGLDITWACNARVDTLDLAAMREMRKANCRLLVVGYESGSDKILKNIKKGTTVNQIREFARNARRAGLLVHGDFIIGLPGETRETIAETKKLIKEVRADILQVSVASPFPGTEFYDWCREQGYLLTDDPKEYLDKQGHQQTIVSYPNLSRQEMVTEVDDILKRYYLSPTYIWLALKQVMHRGGLSELRRLWYSAIMFLDYIRKR